MNIEKNIVPTAWIEYVEKLTEEQLRNKLKAVREERKSKTKISQRKIAHSMGTKHPNICIIETWPDNPDIEKPSVRMVARYLYTFERLKKAK